VAVFAPEDMTDSLVYRICAEAEAIWGSAGIAFEWHRLSPRAQPPAWTLDVTIDDRRTNGASDNALGWLTFTSAGPDRSIHLSRACAEELLLGTPGLTNVTITAHETLVGRWCVLLLRWGSVRADAGPTSSGDAQRAGTRRTNGRHSPAASMNAQRPSEHPCSIQHEIEQPLQVDDGSVRTDAQLLEWLIESIHPDGGISERLRAGSVPSGERRKDDLAL